MDGIALSADHKILKVENESKRGHKNALIVQDDFTNWIQSFPMKTKGYIGNNVAFKEIDCSVTEAGHNLHRQFQSIYLRLSSLQWSHDASISHRSEPNGVAERAVRRVQEGAAIVFVHKADYQKNGGTVRWNAVVTCATCTTLWPMSRQHSTRDLARHLRDHQFLLEHLGDYFPTAAKDNQEFISCERLR